MRAAFPTIGIRLAVHIATGVSPVTAAPVIIFGENIVTALNQTATGGITVINLLLVYYNVRTTLRWHCLLSGPGVYKLFR